MFPADIIVRAIRLVLEGAISLRAASRTCNIIDQCNGGLGLDAPCETTIQNHILRLGLYLIERTDQRRDDWVWLLDHTINAGSTKCLIVLGIALENYHKLSGPMSHHDLVVIAVMPVETSNGEVVCGQLEQLADQFGSPVATLSDRGSDLKKGVELFQQEHPEVASYYDIVHLVSRVIKSIFESDSRWDLYRKACYRCANFLRQSSLAHLKPPCPKTKARYMNYDREVRWAIRAMGVLDRVRSGQINDRQQARLPSKLVEQRLGWLDEYRERASVWLEVIWAGQAINQLVRRNGYTATTADEIRRLGETVDYEESKSLVRQVADEVAPLCQSLSGDAAMPGSTEVLESLIGKGKRLLHHSGNSVTRQILSLAAATTEITTDLIKEALSTCQMKHLRQWARDNLRSGIHVARREDLTAAPEEGKLRKRMAAASPMI
ncbi:MULTISPECIES: hypothetical protein [Rhodopirellula]|uniref:Uncharacterized protein n=1 Tax=Rhodopirellula baltica SWK14 TaxID=993516 RepID=L7CH19_RHOBT|nr:MULTISPECIES: hypothetical protein [Rhodopirellula]ELP33313.1 hypothetical protein RBSWK_02707 [Rhodopirellula baltica SWK14]WDQ16352.1 hypothetical protein PSR62_22405 [Rhodopirellula sp. P2]